MPVDYNQGEDRYNWELLFCEMYAGGKYTAGDDNYEFSLCLLYTSVPVAQRAALPLLAAPGGRVLWLCGQGFGAGLEPTTKTRQVLRLTVQRAETAEFEKSEEWNYEHE